MKKILFISAFVLAKAFFINSQPPRVAASAQNSGNFIWGVNGHPLNQQAYLSTPLSTQFKLIRSLGLTSYRIDISTNAEGTINNLSRFSELMSLAKAYHVKILPVFYLTGFSFELSVESAYNKGLLLGGAIAKKYNVYFDHYELGNEEELKIIGQGTDGDLLAHYDLAKGKKLANFLKGMSKGIKTYQPSAKVIIDFAGWLHYGFLSLLNDEGVKYDIVGLHWYSEMGKLTDINNRHFNMLNLLTDKFRKPIWITEINRRNGSKNDDSGEQSNYLKTYMREARSSGNVKALFIYELLDEPTFGDVAEAHYGIAKWSDLNKKYSLKPFSTVILSKK